MPDVTFSLCSSEEDLQAAYALAVVGYTASGGQVPTIDEFRSIMKRNNMIIGKISGVVVCFRTFKLMPRGVVRIFGLYVSPDHRNQGIGKQIFDYGETLFKSLGGKIIEVPVNAKETGTVVFALKMGFKLYRSITRSGITVNIYRKTIE